MDFIPLKPRRTHRGNQLPQRVSGQGRIAHHAQRNTVCLELFERAYQWQVRHEAFAFHREFARDPFGHVGGVDMEELEQAGGDALEPDFTPRGISVSTTTISRPGIEDGWCCTSVRWTLLANSSAGGSPIMTQPTPNAVP